MATKLFDNTIVGAAEQTVEFISNIIESSTDYLVIGKSPAGNILPWSETWRRFGSANVIQGLQ